jgi:serine O-acetyltransferase
MLPAPLPAAAERYPLSMFSTIREASTRSWPATPPPTRADGPALLPRPARRLGASHHSTGSGAKLRLLARLLSQLTRLLTGIEIHPGARIGRRLFIDHGAGVVIGETAIVGDDVTLYQGVTLGGTGHEHGKRHPTLRDGVFAGSNANILGNICIGENSRVGAGSVVLRDVPPDSTVVGVPAHIVYQNGERVLITDPQPDQATRSPTSSSPWPTRSSGCASASMSSMASSN